MTWYLRLAAWWAQRGTGRRVAALEADVRHLTARCEAAEARETYWRTRAEVLTDAALARAGAIDGPTFAPREVSRIEQGTLALARGLASIGRVPVPLPDPRRPDDEE